MEDKDKKQLSSTPKKHNAFVDWVNGEERPKEEKTVIRENIRRPKKEKKIDEIKNYKKFKKGLYRTRNSNVLCIYSSSFSSS